MRWGWLIMSLWLGGAMADTLDDAQAQFRALHSYQVMVRSVDSTGERQVVRYYYRKPGWVRMEFIQPHPGAVLVYDPGRQRVRVWPFGLGWSLSVSLAPDNPLLRSGNGHRVDQSDVGALLARLQALRAGGHVTPLGESELGGRTALGLDVTGGEGDPRFKVWLTRDTLFPLRVERFEGGGGSPEIVEMVDPRLDVDLPAQFFAP